MISSRTTPAVTTDEEPQPLRKLEIRNVWQAAWLGRIGFSVKACPRGKRFFMVRNG